MKSTIQIGPCCFSVESDIEVLWEPDFQQFMVSEGAAPRAVYGIQGIMELPPRQGECILSRPDVEVYLHEGEEVRYYRIAGNPCFFAMRRGYQVCYLKPWGHWVQQGRLLFSLLGLERMILKEGCILLHSSFIEYNGSGILFAGPSGIGKSTQADLWAQYRSALVVNGDRSLLCKTERGWEAYGWPFSGSSPFCENAHATIKAIVYLEQHGDDTIRRCSYAEAVRNLVSEVTINRWNPEFVKTAVDLIEDLAQMVPLYHLRCTKSEDAVRCLEETIYPA